VLDGLKHALGVRPFLYYLFVSFVGLGIFNGLTTWVEKSSGRAGLRPPMQAHWEL